MPSNSLTQTIKDGAVVAPAQAAPIPAAPAKVDVQAAEIDPTAPLEPATPSGPVANGTATGYATGDPIAGVGADPAARRPAAPTIHRMRPPGEQGGHTVQDWEQSPVAPESPDGSSRATPSPGETPAVATAATARPATATNLAAPPTNLVAPRPVSDLPPPSSAKVLLPHQQALVETLTRSLADMLARALHQGIVEAVHQAGSPAQLAPNQPAVPADPGAPSGRPAGADGGPSSLPSSPGSP